MKKYIDRALGKKKLAPPPVPKGPRSQDEIQREYSQFCAQAGQTQYQIKILSESLNSLNETIKRLNLEAEQRQKLDAAEQAKKASEEAGTKALAELAAKQEAS